MAADLLQPYVHQIRTPIMGEKIYKDECVFSFDTPESADGLYVCLKTFLGFGRAFVEMHHQRTSNAVYLHLRRIKKEIIAPNLGDGEQPKKITKLAIGVEGGFDPNADAKKYEYEDYNTLVILPSFQEISLSDENLPNDVIIAVSTILSADSATKTEELESLAGTWDGEKRKVSKHAENLIQLEPAPKIPPTNWRCDKCDKTENLWLNLSDGSILCGRKYFDGTGGNNHAVEHHEKVRYPLAVKLGTISPNSADVYSYDEDEMVEDPYLEKHLEHFGINIMALRKTEKSMIELEIDYNQRIGEWSAITESDAKLVPLFGPGYTGLSNLGNSCYLNSVVQVLFHIPEIREKYFPPDNIFKNSPEDPSQDFTTQMAKLAYGLWSGIYAKEPESSIKEQDGIKPVMFKNMVGKGHSEFSTKRQQDAQEFFLHLMNLIERNNRFANGENVTQCLSFQIEERVECTASQKVHYTTRTEYLIPLPVPLESATNYQEFKDYEEKKRIVEIAGEHLDNKDAVRAKIPLDSCLSAFGAPELVEDFYSTAINAKTKAKKIARLKSFPDYLVLQIKKFALGEDWMPKKLDVEIDAPDVIDLATLRGLGLQPNEEPLPEQKSPESDHPAVTFDEGHLSQLMELGFSLDAVKRALYNTQNSGVEAAVSWLFDHGQDADFNDPFILDQSSGGSAVATGFTPSAEGLEMLKAMGIPDEHAVRGLKETNNNVERAIDWIFNHPDDLASPMETDEGQAAAEAPAPTFRDGSEKYKLAAFISHMGSSTMCGHYVCHIRCDDKWVIFNDNKVAISENPPKGLAYLYLYKRI
ncbi:Ubiquitin carboxyl-terminal hydrolase 5 [Halotydeus destructor]|nr:Ubiquitin carboxyl-terminal hydrolase 5 [Halotydeus destructor]